MAVHMSQEEKINRINNFINLLKMNENMSVSAAAMSSLRNTDALFAFEKLGLFKKENGQWKYSQHLDQFDESCIKIMAMENWYLNRKEIKKLSESIPESAVDSPTSPHISHTEEISKHMAIIGELLGFQYNGKTPPGLWQKILVVEAENKRLLKENLELKRDLKSISNIRNKYKRENI